MKYNYLTKSFHSNTLEVIDRANEIIEEYQAKGFDLTLRQLYYQFVARNLFENIEKNYSKLSVTISDARLAGLIDWGAIVDRTRYLRCPLVHCDSPEEWIKEVKASAESYHLDKWKNQNYAPEVWIEKDALVGVIANVCWEYDVPYFSCRGYVSQSEMWEAGQRILRYRGEKEDRIPIILHLGDHDPSGMDMSRDIEDRLHIFCGWCFTFERIALNVDQIEKYEPPPNPAKIRDTRFKQYAELYGNDSWELDSLEPDILANLIQTEILNILDTKKWALSQNEEIKHRKYLLEFLEGRK